MAYQLVTCPETAHLEMIEYDDPPLGLLIVECSRFCASRGLACPRTCAARLDRRAREPGERGFEREVTQIFAVPRWAR